MVLALFSLPMPNEISLDVKNTNKKDLHSQNVKIRISQDITKKEKIMKKLSTVLFLLLAVLALSFVSCDLFGGGDDGGTTTVAVTGVVISGASSIDVGNTRTVQLTATVAPTNATNKNMSWSSSNEAVATVSTTGLVTGAADSGSAVITVTTADGNFTDEVTVTAVPYVAVTGVVLYDNDNPNSAITTYEIIANESAYIIPVVMPDTATEQGWSVVSSAPTVASVEMESDYFELIGLTAGSATITVTTDDGDFTAALAVTVLADTVDPQLDSGLFLSSTEVYLDFSEKLSSSGAGTASNYTISGAISGNPTSATLYESGDVVVLVLSSALTAGNQITVTATGITDLAGNSIDTIFNTINLTFYTPPAPADATKITIAASQISGAAGAVPSALDASLTDAASWMIMAVPAGTAIAEDAIVGVGFVDASDGSFGNMTSDFEPSSTNYVVFDSGNYDLYVVYQTADESMAFSTKITVTVP